MAEDYVLETAPASRNDKFLKIFIITASVCLAGELIWLLGISPFRPFQKIDISGSEEFTREEVLEMALLPASASYFSTDVRSAEKALMRYSALESAKVLKHFPDRLQIVLEGRKAVASVLASAGGRTIPVLFDSEGVIFKVGSAYADEIISGQLPVISGIVIEEPYPGMRLPPLFTPLFREIEKIRLSSPKLLEAVSEIRISPRAFDSFDIILYPVHKKISVRLSELNEELLRYSLLMVDVLSSKENGIESLDFRSGVASYIPKEENPEQ